MFGKLFSTVALFGVLLVVWTGAGLLCRVAEAPVAGLAVNVMFFLSTVAAVFHTWSD